MPSFKFENAVWKNDFKIVAGIDEVGRGSFAGPVVAAAVAFAPMSNYQFPMTNEFSNEIIINDSKQLTAKQREIADIWIRKHALGFGIGEASVAQINKFGIKKASEIAFRKAIINSRLAVDFLLIDAFYIPYVKNLRRKNQKAIIKGDTKSISIAAASIIAKVYRDKLMASLSKQSKYKKYGWDKNKGYGTKQHREAILKYGITKLHRKLFVRNCVSSQVQ